MPLMTEKDKRFELRLSSSERRALEKLAERAGKTKSAYVANYIRREANKKGIQV